MTSMMPGVGQPDRVTQEIIIALLQHQLCSPNRLQEAAS